MILKLKSGLLVNIPHLKGKSEEEANNFFNSFQNTGMYNLRLINDDWYAERVTEDIDSIEDPNNTVVAGCTYKGLKEFAEKIIELFEVIEPEYYKKLENWCNPQVYFFVGDWKDINKSYACLPGLNL